MKSIFCKILWVVYAFVLGQGIYEVYGWLCGTARGVFGMGNIAVGALVAIGGVLVLLAVYILVVRVVERRWTVELAVPKIPKSLAMGWGVGVFVLVGTALVMALLGCYRVESIGLQDWKALLFYLPFFLMVGVGEELIFRGLLFRIIDEQWNTIAACVISALLFGFLHITSPGATVWSSIAIAIEAGVLETLIYKRTGSLWTAIALHWAWNFLEGPVLGCQVSGVDFGARIITPVISGPDITTGGVFGPEASWIAIVMSLIPSVWLCQRGGPGLRSKTRNKLQRLA